MRKGKQLYAQQGIFHLYVTTFSKRTWCSLGNRITHVSTHVRLLPPLFTDYLRWADHQLDGLFLLVWMCNLKFPWANYFQLLRSSVSSELSLILINVPKIFTNPCNLSFEKFFHFDARYFNLMIHDKNFVIMNIWKIQSRTIDFRSKFKNVFIETEGCPVTYFSEVF